jgi:phage major head subunit gpT-like protein
MPDFGTGIGAPYSSRAVIGNFYARLAGTAPPAWVPRLAFRVDSDQASEDIRFLGMSPAMRRWVGGRQAQGFRSNAIAVENLLFEATIEVDVDDLRRDKTGQFMARIMEQPARAQSHRAKLLTDLLIAGESTNCYDGQFFFDTDHAEGDSGTQSNDLVFDISDNATGGTATAPSAATMQRGILAAVQAILGFKDDKGEPMNEGAAAFDVMVPPGMMGATLEAVTLPLIGGGNSNVLAANTGLSLTPVINPRLSWTTKFAVFRTDAETKPLIEQIEFDPTIAAIAEGSEMETKDRKHLYTITRSGNVAYGYWQQACMVTLQA